MKDETPFVITVSRQLGSGGAYIGRKLAQALDLFYADREIITRTANELSCLEESLADRDEKVSTFWEKYFTANALGASGEYVLPQAYVPTDYELFEAETDVIRHIAERPSVIIGRCGAHILHDRPNSFHVFLHANHEFRIGRISEVRNISRAAADKTVTKSDMERAKYHSAFARENWMDLSLYDVCLDTGRLGMDYCADVLLHMLQDRIKK